MNEEFINKVICGDCLEILPKIKSNSIDLIVTDPPYNINKTEWDNLGNTEKYTNWCIKWIKECERVLKKNGTLWFFHTKFHTISRLNILIEDKTNFRFKQFIIINKGLQSVAGRTCPTLRSFPKATEYLLFYTFEDITGTQQLSDKYAKINPMAKYLKEEFRRAKITNKKIASLFPSKTGGMTGCVSNWLLGYNFPTKEQYEKMREYLNGEYLRKEYEDLRYVFNLPYGITDIWKINFYEDNINGHLTVKPEKLIWNIIKVASNENQIILDPFLGSGTTAVVCKKLNRNFIGIEINPEYCKIAEERLKKLPERLDNILRLKS